MMVLFTTPRGQNPPRGKKADVALQFTEGEGALLAGLELQGLAVWSRADGSGLFVTLPGREYDVVDASAPNGKKRKTFDFLRYTNERDRSRLDNLKALILEQYQDWAVSQ